MVKVLTYQVVDCVLCDKKLRTPCDVGTIRVTCPNCFTQWEMSTHPRTQTKVQAAITSINHSTATSSTCGKRLADFDPYVPIPHPASSGRIHNAKQSASSTSSGNPSFGMSLYVIWLVGSFVAIPYYNWQFAQQHGFAAWLMFGGIVATLQGIFWPLLLLLSYSN